MALSLCTNPLQLAPYFCSQGDPCSICSILPSHHWHTHLCMFCQNLANFPNTNFVRLHSLKPKSKPHTCRCRPSCPLLAATPTYTFTVPERGAFLAIFSVWRWTWALTLAVRVAASKIKVLPICAFYAPSTRKTNRFLFPSTQHRHLTRECACRALTGEMSARSIGHCRC